MTCEAPQFTKTEFRQIRYLLYFVVFIIVFQIFQYVTTKRVTHRYKDLFRQATELLTLSNSLSFETANIHRFILNLSFTTDSSEVHKFSTSLRCSEDCVAKNIQAIEQEISRYNLYSFEKTLSFEVLKVTNQRYRKRYETYLGKLNSLSGEARLRYRQKFLRPALEACQEQQKLFMLKIFADQHNVADVIAEDADHTGFNLLIGGNILLLAIALLLGYIIVSERKKVVP